MRDKLRVAQVGVGAWGRNLLRELTAHPRVEVVCVVDANAGALTSVRSMAQGAWLAPSVEAVREADADAAVIATPGPLHAAHAKLALERGLHVLVEKPMATSAADAEMLLALATRRGLVGMVGHLLQHHAAVRAMVDVVRSGRIGAMRSFRSARLCTRGSRDVDGSLIWSLAPHDVSILRALDPTSVRRVSARVRRLPPDSAGWNVADLRIEMASGVDAHVMLSRANRIKVRRMEVVCERGTIVFDDVVESDKLRILCDGAEEPLAVATARAPLTAEVDAFVRSVLDGLPVRTSFAEGSDVVRVLAAAQRCVESSLSSPPLSAAR
jgi:predicted dehydrogenase